MPLAKRYLVNRITLADEKLEYQFTDEQANDNLLIIQLFFDRLLLNVITIGLAVLSR